MHLTLFSIAGLTLSTTCFFLTLVILFFGKSSLHKIWALFNVTVGLWGMCAFFIGKITDKDTALIVWRITHISIAFIPIFMFHVVYKLCNLRSQKLLYFAYFQGIFFSILSVTSRLFIPDVRFVFNAFYYDVSGPLFHPFFAIWGFLVGYTHFKLFITYLHAKGRLKNQILYLFVGSALGFSGGITNFLPALGIDLYPIGNFTIPIYCLIVTYAMLRYRLMDITVAITRTGIFVAVYSLVLGIPFVMAYGLKPQLIELFGMHWWVLPLVSSTVLATAGPFIYLFIQKRAEDRLLREQRAYQTTLRQASQGMNQIRDLNKLLNLIVRIVTRTVHLKNGAIYLLDEEKNVFILQAERDLSRNNPIPRGSYAISRDAVLMQELLRVREPLVYEEIKQRLQDYQDSNLASLEAQMKQIGAAVVVPSFAGEELVGFLVLGEKTSGKLYSQDDLVVFSVLANQAALAIENAKFYEDVKKTQQQLFQAEKMATIGTLANGLSHQISNRLQALGFIAGDTLDTLKLAGDKPYPSEIKELLNSIAAALEKVLANVTQGGEVVRGMLKYSRPGEEGFSPINLDQLITASLEMVQYKVKLDRLDISREFSKDLPAVRGNFTQLQEVFFNLVDNAYDAINQRKEELQEPDFKGKITISAEALDGTLEIRFQDNGMGVRGQDASKLFTPFFTTKTSSKKGTGLGLYVIQKIITNNHNGRIRMESKYKEGTSFIIELPISRG